MVEFIVLASLLFFIVLILRILLEEVIRIRSTIEDCDKICGLLDNYCQKKNQKKGE
jgi:hypothetical protein